MSTETLLASVLRLFQALFCLLRLRVGWMVGKRRILLRGKEAYQWLPLIYMHCVLLPPVNDFCVDQVEVFDVIRVRRKNELTTSGTITLLPIL